jgi:hypothetical protein
MNSLFLINIKPSDLTLLNLVGGREEQGKEEKGGGRGRGGEEQEENEFAHGRN